jgi:hypothetical protein
VIVVGSTLGITLEGVLTAAVFRLMMAGGSTDIGASRAMVELKLEDTVLDGVLLELCVVDGVLEGWLGLKRLNDCTPKLGLETLLERVKLMALENTVEDGVPVLLEVVSVLMPTPGRSRQCSAAQGVQLENIVSSKVILCCLPACYFAGDEPVLSG